MQPTLCSRCKKNVAVVFISKLDGEKTVNEGLCLKCAKELGIKPINDMMSNIESCIGDAVSYIDRLLENYLLKDRKKEE